MSGLNAKLLQVVNGQFVQVGDDFFGYCQLLCVVGIYYGDGVHSLIRYEMGFSACLAYRSCYFDQQSRRYFKARSPFD